MVSPAQQEIRRSVAIQAIWSLVYAVVLGLAVVTVFAMPELGNWRSAIMLLPLVPAIGLLHRTVRQFARMDEMQLRHQLEAIAWAFGAAVMLMVSYALLEVVGWPRLPMWVPLVVLQAVWIVCIWVQRLRFR